MSEGTPKERSPIIWYWPAQRPKNGNWLRKPNHRKKIPVRYPFNIVEKRHNRKSLEGRFQSKTQTAINGIENTVKTDTGKVIHQNIISGPLFQSEKRHRIETVTAVSAGATPKNRHCLRGLDGKYGKWDDILRDMFNRKLRIVQNKKRTEAVSEGDEDDNDEKEEILEETEECTTRQRETVDTNRSGLIPRMTRKHTEGEIPQGEKSISIRRSNRNMNKPNRNGSVPYQENLNM